MSPAGSIIVFGLIGEFLAGLTVPVPYMPSWLQQIVYALPFRWTADFPFRVYSGNIPHGEALIGLAVQAVWLVALTLLGRWLLGRTMRKVVVQGG